MKYLLDTHTFLWSLTEEKRIPEKTLREIKNPDNEVFVSAVSFWEIAIKMRLQKLDLDGLPTTDLPALAERMHFQLIHLTPEEAVSYGKLVEKSHKDPFDRMLIWQCIKRTMTMVSRDGAFCKFKEYGLKVLLE